MADVTAPARRLDRLVFGSEIPEPALAKLRSEFPDVNIIFAPGPDFIRALPDADAAVAWSMTPEEFEAAKKLTWFQSFGAGVEHVILPGMRERGLIVTNSSGIHGTNIAEHLLAMMLAFARQLPRLIRYQTQAEWCDDIRPDVFELNTQTLHIVGYGDIGQALARIAKGLGMRVTGTRRHTGQASDGVADEIAGFDQLPRQLAAADHVAICLPQTEETIGLFDADLIGQMKSGSYLYNIGRGPIIVTQALIDALDSGHLGGAGLDVTDPEPLSSDSPLWKRENVIITAHTAGSTPYYMDRLIQIVSENVRRFHAGEPLVNVVDIGAGY